MEAGRLFKPGESALEAMNANEIAMTEIFPVGPNGELETPPELIGKTVEELRAMGAREVGYFDGGDFRFKPMEG